MSEPHEGPADCNGTVYCTEIDIRCRECGRIYIDSARLAEVENRAQEAEQRLRNIKSEINCRIGHGAESNGHLEGLLSIHKFWGDQ